MEDLIHDFPFSLDFKKSKQVGEPMTGPVVEFQSHRSNRASKINTGNPVLKLCRRPVLIVPVKEPLNRPGEQIRTDISKDRGIGVEGRLHVVASARPAAVDILLDDMGNRLILAQIGWCGS